MRSLLLPWTTRGLRYESRNYLSSLTLDSGERIRDIAPEQVTGPIHPDMVLPDAFPVLAGLRGVHGGDIEYGCFHLNGTLIEDPGLRIRRQIRNILYYTIKDLSNISRGVDSGSAGPPFGADPVPEDPQGNWAVVLSEACPNIQQVRSALEPLIRRRSGQIITIPKMDPASFTQWLADQFNDRTLPSYLLICDSFDNILLEYQVIFNAFAVTGRLWFDDPALIRAYVEKVLAVEQGQLDVGQRRVVACPCDDDVTYADYQQIIMPMLDDASPDFIPLEPLVEARFNERSVLDAARDTQLLALYCHGLGLNRRDYERHPDLMGALVLQFGSREDEGLLTPDEVVQGPFVPGGIVFTPACMAGGTQSDSDFVAWLEDDSLAPYVGADTRMSALSQAMLGAPQGPAIVLAHFDISMGGTSPMYNPMTQTGDLQKEIHIRFLRNLLEGQTVGKATEPFRWAAGAYYAQAIYIFGQIAGSVPYFGRSNRTIGQMVSSMNQYHVVASDMRNYLILGDPAVRLPAA